MKFSVYLPDALGQRAKTAQPELNLSRLLRTAVAAEFERRDLMSAMLDDSQEIELELRDENDVSLTGFFTGTEIAEKIFLTDDERVIVYDELEQWFKEFKTEELEDSV